MRHLPPVQDDGHRTPTAAVRPTSFRSAIQGLNRLLGGGGRRRSDPGALRLALECRACRRTYRHEVETVYIDPEHKDADPHIANRIQCPGCGRWDDYAFTAEAHVEILTECLRLLDNARSGKEAPRSPIVLVDSGLQDGRRMPAEDGLREYERRLVEHPDDPGLHIGRANILRFLKRIDAAEDGYRRALELDPHAAEAYSSLARIAAEHGDVRQAARGFARCVRALAHGHFYRVAEGERDAFAAAVREEAERLRHLAGPEGEQVDRSAGPENEAPQRRGATPVVGRNAPCPCGSGKKHKKCCLLEPSTLPGAGIGLAADEELARYLPEFAARVPRRERDRATGLYAEVHPPSAETAEDAHADAVGFMDWFINDYRLGTSGRTLVEEVLASRSHPLTPVARTLLASWRDAPVNLYEVVSVEPGTAITFGELLGSGRYRVRDVRGSRVVARWDVVATRLIPIDGAMCVAASVRVFRPEEKQWLVEAVQDRFHAWRQGHPNASVEQFLKADGLLFGRLAGELAERRREKAEHLTMVSGEGHAVVSAKARYKITEAAAVLAALRSVEDFAQSEPGPGERAHFVWLKLAESARLAVASHEVPEGALQLQASFCATLDAEPVPTLGDVRIRGSRLYLQCLSRERLAWGKARLAGLLGNAVRFEGEELEAIDAKAAAGRRLGRRRSEAGQDAGLDRESDDETLRGIASRHLRDHYRRWIDQPLPALGGHSPRQAARVPERRNALEALLRQLENIEDRRRITGAASCEVSWIRGELGM